MLLHLVMQDGCFFVKPYEFLKMFHVVIPFKHALDNTLVSVVLMKLVTSVGAKLASWLALVSLLEYVELLALCERGGCLCLSSQRCCIKHLVTPKCPLAG